MVNNNTMQLTQNKDRKKNGIRTKITKSADVFITVGNKQTNKQLRCHKWYISSTYYGNVPGPEIIKRCMYIVLNGVQIFPQNNRANTHNWEYNCCCQMAGTSEQHWLTTTVS